MAARVPSVLRTLALTRPATPPSLAVASRSFQTSAKRLQDVAPVPVRKPVGGFRGSIFGFLLGSVLSGGAMYYYVVDEYKVSNELLTEDIYTLQAAVQRIEAYVRNLETEVKSKK